MKLQLLLFIIVLFLLVPIPISSYISDDIQKGDEFHFEILAQMIDNEEQTYEVDNENGELYLGEDSKYTLEIIEVSQQDEVLANLNAWRTDYQISIDTSKPGYIVTNDWSELMNYNFTSVIQYQFNQFQNITSYSVSVDHGKTEDGGYKISGQAIAEDNNLYSVPPVGVNTYLDWSFSYEFDQNGVLIERFSQTIREETNREFVSKSNEVRIGFIDRYSAYLWFIAPVLIIGLIIYRRKTKDKQDKIDEISY